MLHKAGEEGRIEGIRVCKGALRINHLFFADYSLILMRECKGDAQELRRILQVYERASGQMINRDISVVLFIPNTTFVDKEEVGKVLNIV
jgi:hypothetical protein